MKLPPFLTEVEPNEIRLTGRRLGLYHLISFHRNEGMGEEALADWFDIPQELVRDVLGFYAENRAEVDAYVAWYKAELDRIYREIPSIDPEMVRKRAIAMGIDVEAQRRMIDQICREEGL